MYPQERVLTIQQGVPALLLRVRIPALDSSGVPTGTYLAITSISTDFRRSPVDRSKPTTTWLPIIASLVWVEGDDNWWEGSITAAGANALAIACCDDRQPPIVHWDVYVGATGLDPIIPLRGTATVEGQVSNVGG